MAKTMGRVTGVKRTTDTVVTATGTIATHVDAENEDGVKVVGAVFPGDANHPIIARAGIKVGGKWLAELTLYANGHLSLNDWSGNAIEIAR